MIVAVTGPVFPLWMLGGSPGALPGGELTSPHGRISTNNVQSRRFAARNCGNGGECVGRSDLMDRLLFTERVAVWTGRIAKAGCDVRHR